MRLSHGMYDDLPKLNVTGLDDFKALALRYTQMPKSKAASSGDGTRGTCRKLREYILSGCANMDVLRRQLFPEEIFDRRMAESPIEKLVRGQLSAAYQRKAAYGHPVYAVGDAPLFENPVVHIHSYEKLFRRINPRAALAWTDYTVMTALERTDEHTNICFTQSSGNGEMLRRYAPLMADQFLFAMRRSGSAEEKGRPRDIPSRVFVHVPAEYGDDRLKSVSATPEFKAALRREEFRLMDTQTQTEDGHSYVVLDRLPPLIDYGFYKNYKYVTTEHQRANTPDEDMDFRGFALRAHLVPQLAP